MFEWMSLAGIAVPESNADAVELPSRSTYFWGGLGVFWCALVLSWTVGGLLQLKNLPLGLAITELLFFGLPAFLFLRRYRDTFSLEPFRNPPSALVPWVVWIALCAVILAVIKGAGLRQSIGLSLPEQRTSLPLLLVMGTFAPICEELVMRPVLQRALALYWQPRNAVVGSALLFALLHGSWLRFGETFILGLFAGIIFLKTGNYWLCVLFHALANFSGPWLLQVLWPVQWLQNPAASILLVMGVGLGVWRITQPAEKALRGWRERLHWLFFGGVPAAVRFAKNRRMPAAYWTGAALLIVALSAVLPLELKSVSKSLLSVGGEISKEKPAAEVFRFHPTKEKISISLRADTTAGYMGFTVHDPGGELIGKRSGGGLSIGKWILPTVKQGTYRLEVTPYHAEGKWKVEIEE